MAAISDIKISEMENESPFTKYTTLENNTVKGKFSFPKGSKEVMGN